jgi:hypothetical protein
VLKLLHWHLAFGIWHLAFGIWHLAFGNGISKNHIMVAYMADFLKQKKQNQRPACAALYLYYKVQVFLLYS